MTRILLFLILSCTCSVAFAQEERLATHNTIGWFMYTGGFKIAPRLTIHTEYQWRRVDAVKNWQQGLARTSLNYSVRKDVSLNAGYAFAQTFPYGDYPPAFAGVASAKAAAQNTAIVTPANAPVIPGVAAPGTPVTLTQPQAVTMNPQNAVVSNPQMITQTAPAQTATAPGMNPPHGQPGHRCDIAVGAPLNSKPAAPATVATTNAQPQVTMTEVPTTTKTAPGMNPPHGEPGHRCDIAVGAPLNSKPAAPATVTTTSAPATITPPALLTAPKSDSTKN